MAMRLIALAVRLYQNFIGYVRQCVSAGVLFQNNHLPFLCHYIVFVILGQ